MRLALAFVGAFFAFVVSGIPAYAEIPEYVIRIKDHRFIPAQFEVPAGQKVKLVVRNEDKTAEEFESHSLRREKIVAGGKKIIVFIGPLKPGNYEFFGEFNMKTAQGVITVK